MAGAVESNQDGGGKRGRGRPSNPDALGRRTVEIPDDLWAWARNQPEGAARLVPDLLGLEQKHRGPAQVSASRKDELTVPTAGGVMVVVRVPEGVLVLFEEELVVQCLYDTSWGSVRVHVPVRIERLEVRQEQAKRRSEQESTMGHNEKDIEN